MENPGRFRTEGGSNEHRGRHESATGPPKLTKEHKRQTFAVYKIAERLTEGTGIEHEVGHIVPLFDPNLFGPNLFGQNKGGEVAIRGLPVPWNLRAIPRSLNRKRGDWFYIHEAEAGIAII